MYLKTVTKYYIKVLGKIVLGTILVYLVFLNL